MFLKKTKQTARLFPISAYVWNRDVSNDPKGGEASGGKNQEYSAKAPVEVEKERLNSHKEQDVSHDLDEEE